MTPPFRDASHLLRPNLRELNYGCVMADIDGDGWPEILSVGVHAPNRLYAWRGDTLADIAPPILQDRSANGIGVACGDFAGDGRLDIYLLNTSAFLGPKSDPDRLLVNEGGLRFYDAMANHAARNEAAGRSVCWLDIGGSGRYSAYVCNYAVASRLYGHSQDGDIADLAPLLGLNQVAGGRVAVAADILGTGRTDLFAGNEGGANYFFRNDGRRSFVECAKQLGLDDPGQHMRGLALCDFDRDGRMDLVWGNWEGPHRIMHQTPDGRFENVADLAFAQPSRVRTVIAFDYDNDGWEDIFLNNIGEPNRLFHNNGDGTFLEVDPGDLRLEDGLGTGATCGDIDGDGFLDVFVSHGESMPQANSLMLNTPNGNNWLRVHARTPKGAPAIGAKVTLWAGGDPRPMTRFIDGGSGYLCQMEPVAHFGLGRATRADRIEVRMTTGRSTVLENVEANQNLVVAPKGEGWMVEPLKREPRGSR